MQEPAPLTGAPSTEERARALEAIASEVRVCTKCRLSETRTYAVPGEGHPETEVFFVGEGPGYNEDQQGRPFVGAAGGLLTELLGAVDWKRDEVFITNVVKCRPPGNRDPEPAEISTCRPYLDRQEAALDPAVIVTLGRHSLRRYLPDARIGEVHGRLRRSGGRFVFPMYHPAAALHQSSLRETLFGDIRGLPAALLAAREAIEAERAESVQASSPDPEPTAPTAETDEAEQMTLF